ncbi:anthranilate synthase component II [Sphingomonas jaspsi]|uniref:anthranilate synthase component II n=1 Tax=Sphingomonas jaspsi TaxID=392409 RepID=UPI0004B21DA6|nr:aminodeoxychorismate/anthranilate synthase component II [Sphingomonas jaspsi]
MTPPRLLLVDNVDSFTFMLADYLRVAGAEVEVARSDALSVEEALSQGDDGIVISPGPGSPDEAGISVALAAACIDRQKPLLGVCLGHQAIARACGQSVARTAPVHGKVSVIRHDGTGLFAAVPSPMNVTRYHSLAVPSVQPPLVANCWGPDGSIMAMRHVDAPVHGVQFHPESVASDHGHALIANFLAIVAQCA